MKVARGTPHLVVLGPSPPAQGDRLDSEDGA
jgi:hypothetical protein